VVIRPRTYELARAPGQVSGRALLAQVSALYYLDGRTQDDIAQRLRLSRAKVSRLLHAAREAGLVRIFVRPPPGTFLSIETELEARFGVREVRIVPSSCDEPLEETRRKLGAAAAADLVRSAKSGQTVGLVGQELLASMVDAATLRVAADVRVVQGLGWEHGSSPQRTLADLVLDLARRIQGTAVVLPAPSVVDSEQVRRSIEVDPQISDVLHTLDALDTLYTEIAPPASGVVDASNQPTPLGRIAFRHFDCRGQLLGAAVDGHIVGLTIDQLRRARHVVALAHDPAQAHVIAAALRTRLVGTLVTDHRTACAVAAIPMSRADALTVAGARKKMDHRLVSGETHDDDA
jgi:deoxyribonucleoside regulator